LNTVSTFVLMLQEPEAPDLLPFIVTPESLQSWLNQVETTARLVHGRGLTNRPEYPSPNVALVKLPPDPGEHVKATGRIPLPPDTLIVTLQRRPELPQEAVELGGWRVHAITPRVPTPDDIAGLWHQ
jgi:hypothetical protein